MPAIISILTKGLWGAVPFLLFVNRPWLSLGDAYALGPYVAWLDFSLPLAAVAILGLVLVLALTHKTRTLHPQSQLYALLLLAGLMGGVVVSERPEISVCWWLTWLLATSFLLCRLGAFWQDVWSYRLYAGAVLLSLVLYFIAPQSVNESLLGGGAWLFILHFWRQKTTTKRFVLSVSGLALLGVYLRLDTGLLLLMWLSLALLWAQQYFLYRRKALWPWFIGWVFLGLWLGISIFPAWQWQNLWLNGAFDFHFLGVGLGQLEWAAYHQQALFTDPTLIESPDGVLPRWWYESGLSVLIWLPCLWLLCVGHAKALVFRTLLFWGTVLLAPALWLNPSGILLMGFWFFNRASWEKTEKN